ncbi:MAG: hypothetical protein WAK60_07500 [Sedimentisphaerales bacterium]
MKSTNITICVSIIMFATVFALWVLVSLAPRPRIKTLFISSLTSFIVVWICLINWWVGGIKVIESLHIDEVILVPGFAVARLIAAQIAKIDRIGYLSNFEGSFFGIVMYVSSFVLYTVVFAMIISRVKKTLLPQNQISQMARTR